MRNFLDVAVKITTIVALITSSGLMVYFLAVKPQQNKRDLSDCLKGQAKEARERWDKFCQGSDTCSLGEQLNDEYEQQRQECYQRYPQKVF